MIIVLEPQATEEQIKRVAERVREFGFEVHISRGVERTILGVIGDRDKDQLAQAVEAMAGVEKTVPILHPFKLASLEFHPERTAVRVGPVVIGLENLVVMAGPCAVESEEQIILTARAVQAAGAQILRGGAYKPRTSPYAFQGLQKEGLKMLAAARAATGLPVVSEVMNPRDVELVGEYVDMLQIGARNMQNFSLLREVGRFGKPVLLKRGLAATIEEWLMAAEYILSEGNYQVVLCERGIRTFETMTRNTLDVGAIAVVKALSHLPVVADPSHAAGKWRWVGALAKAALAAGADGLLIEVHPDPERALSDGPQSLNFANFASLMQSLAPLAGALGRRLEVPSAQAV
ncbi:MAG: 3-deoxy-7-phosphoheptulonate synthase [Bacillota bacterium]|nr:3-deoxy-7-phosphoheptulonate synthase [Bacillota bacterium]